MSESISIELSPLDAVRNLAALWRDLDKRGQHSFFAAWPWIGTWLALLPPSLSPLLLRIVKNGDCAGAAVLVRRPPRSLCFNATGVEELDYLTIEHNGFAGLAPGLVAPWHDVLAWFAAGKGDADTLILPGIGDECIEATLPPRLLLRKTAVPAFRVDLGVTRASGGAIGAILSTNARQQLSRSRRALGRSGPLVIETAASADEAIAFFDALERFHVRSWTRRGRRHAFTNSFFGTFHRSLIRNNFADGCIELLRLSAGGRELGYLYNFLRNGHVYAYQSGFDDEDRRLRPGYVAHAMAIEAHAAAGDAIYDFMAGSNRLKESFSTDRYTMNWYVVQIPLLKFRLASAARHFRTRLKSQGSSTRSSPQARVRQPPTARFAT